MNDSYKELSRRATKGDKEALRELFALGQKHEVEHRFEDATAVFRDAAISYRISAFRNLARAEDAESRAAELATVGDIYRRWIEENPKGMRELPRPASIIDSEYILRVLKDDLSRERFFVEVLYFLEDTLAKLGMEFYSPGGSVLRRVWQLLGEVFGLSSSGHSEYLQHMPVRVGLDLLADEIAKRCQHGQPDAPADPAPLS